MTAGAATVYAHRGLHAFGHPENSLAAFRAAADGGWGIETDLRSTSDGAVVLFHDRCVGGMPVSSMTRAALEAGVGREVPTLGDLLRLGLDTPLDLEAKTPEAFALALPEILAAGDRVSMVSSFRHDVAVAAASTGLPAAYLMASRPHSGDPLPKARTGLTTVVFDFGMVDQTLVDRARSAGLIVGTYGSITREEHVHLAAMGVTTIITDRPDLVDPGAS